MKKLLSMMTLGLAVIYSLTSVPFKAVADGNVWNIGTSSVQGDLERLDIDYEWAAKQKQDVTFLGSLLYGDNLYIYYYSKWTHALANLSKVLSSSSTTTVDDQYVEHYQDLNVQYIHSYGSYEKAVIKNVSAAFTEDDDYQYARFRIKQMTFDYDVPIGSAILAGKYSVSYGINYEGRFALDLSNNDIIKQEFNERRILIPDTRGGIRLTPTSNHVVNTPWNELFYLFFDIEEDYDYDKLVNVELTYDVRNYTMLAHTEININTISTYWPYLDYWGNISDAYGYTLAHQYPNVRKQKVVSADEYVDLDYNNQFLFWNKMTSKKYNSLVKVSDLTTAYIEAHPENEEDYTWIKTMASEGKDGLGIYQYSLMFDNYTRTFEQKDGHYYKWGWYYTKTVDTYSYCHDFARATILNLSFLVNGEVITLSADAAPTDSSFVSVDAPYVSPIEIFKTIFGDPMLAWWEKLLNVLKIVGSVVLVVIGVIVLIKVINLIINLLKALSKRKKVNKK
jgi:hypothetical protein